MPIQPKQERSRKRPSQILKAALQEFSARGFSDCRLEDVASRVGISKGTIYRYFPNKEELFCAVIQHQVVERLKHLDELTATHEGSIELFLRSKLIPFFQAFLASDARHVARLVMAEGPKFPQVAEFYYREVVQKGTGILRGLIEKGVERGEFRRTDLSDFPQLIMAPALMALIWNSLFSDFRPLDLSRLLHTHIDLLLEGLKS